MHINKAKKGQNIRVTFECSMTLVIYGNLNIWDSTKGVKFREFLWQPRSPCNAVRDEIRQGHFPDLAFLSTRAFFSGSTSFFSTIQRFLPNIWILHTTTTTLRKRGGLMMMMLVCTKNLHDVCEWSWWYKQIQWNARCCYAQDLYDKEEDFSGDEGKICKNHTS